MKKYILLIILFMYSHAYTETFNYTVMENVEGFDGIFILSNPNDDARKLQLDCQSFFHKLDIHDKNNNLLSENFISFGECEFLFENFNSCLNQDKIKCVDTEDMFNLDCECK